MQAPTKRVHGFPEPAADHPVNLTGDAWVTITAPFYPDGDPLLVRHDCALTGETDLDGTGALRFSELPLRSILQGTLTYQRPSVDALTSFVGGEAWLAGVQAALGELVPDPTGRGGYDQIELAGMLFPDGYGSVAITLRRTGGWEPDRREVTMDAIGVVGRELLAARLREALLPPLQRLLRRAGAGADTVAVLPYFNLTYAGSTEHPQPGRSTLDDELRPLVYPDAAAPLPSSSPWLDEYLYTGYAYHLLARRDPETNLGRLALLLLILNVSYARLARFAAAADQALHGHNYHTEVTWLADVERRLRSEYQSLITPTFSFDHHALMVRDAVLRSWDVPTLQARADNLISMVRNAVEFRMAQDHARRIRRLNLIVVVLTALSVIPTVEALLSLYRSLTS